MVLLLDVGDIDDAGLSARGGEPASSVVVGTTRTSPEVRKEM
jgi:hypothetical protein